MTAPVSTWLAGPMSPAVARCIARLAATPDVRRVAVMPDVHLADDVCVGVAVATGATLLPDAVGGDLGCGMTTVRFDMDADALRAPGVATAVLDDLAAAVPALKQRRPTPSAPPPPARAPARARRDAAVQFGTLGRGNHFLELQRDEAGALWALVHSGSRALGPAVRDLHVRGAPRTGTGLAVLDADGPAGRAYVEDLAACVAWAAANRDAVLAAAEAVLERRLGARADPTTTIRCVHNAVARERVGDADAWVHRKGAAPAGAGVAAVVPGSMGTATFHVVGLGVPEALASCSHGAGRALSRAAARARFTASDLRRRMRGIAFDADRAADLVDEAPGAYHDIGAVLAAQRDLVRVVRRLTPVLSWKGR